MGKGAMALGGGGGPGRGKEATAPALGKSWYRLESGQEGGKRKKCRSDFRASRLCWAPKIQGKGCGWTYY